MAEKQSGDLERVVLRVVEDVLGRKVSLDDEISSIEGWDSLKHLQIILEVEDRTGRKIPMEEIGRIERVRDILKLLR